MAQSETDIINDALIELGQELISNRSDPNKRARMANMKFDGNRDRVLRLHRWNSSIRRAQLSPLATGPLFTYTNAFQLPTDFIRLSSLDNLNIQFKIEHGVDGKVIVSDESTINLIYIARITDVTQMDDLLTDTISARLAAGLAIALTGSREKRNDMIAIFNERLADARFIDSLESPVEQFEGQTWLDARQGQDNVFFTIKPV